MKKWKPGISRAKPQIAPPPHSSPGSQEGELAFQKQLVYLQEFHVKSDLMSTADRTLHLPLK